MPTVAFHIGMSKQEFENNISKIEKEKLTVELIGDNENLYKIDEKFFRYYFLFKNDTLALAYQGALHWLYKSNQP